MTTAEAEGGTKSKLCCKNLDLVSYEEIRHRPQATPTNPHGTTIESCISLCDTVSAMLTEQMYPYITNLFQMASLLYSAGNVGNDADPLCIAHKIGAYKTFKGIKLFPKI